MQIGHTPSGLCNLGKMNLRVRALQSPPTLEQIRRRAVAVATREGRPTPDSGMDLTLSRPAHSGDKTAYTFLDNGEAVSETINYADFAEQVLALAATLQQRCSPRDRVLILYPPCIDYMVGFFACLCADLIAVPLFPPRGTKHNLRPEAIARDCRPR